MRTLAISLVVALASVTFAADERPAGDGGKATPEALAAGNRAFAVKLYRELCAKEGNLFFSPYSLAAGLGLVYAGARGDTAAEIAKTLEFSATPEQLPALVKKLHDTVAANAHKGGQKLNLANGMCLTDGEVSKEFKALMHGQFGAEIFSGQVDQVNSWVKQKTEGKIEKILEKLSPNSVCVLLNAIYFKGAWASPFKREATREAPFRPAPGKEIQVPLMHQRGRFRLLQEKTFQALVLPYQGQALSLVILLPRAVDGLAGLEQTLTADTLSQWLGAVDKQPENEVEVYVPRCKLATDYDLVPACQAMGMKKAFAGSQADFGGMGWSKGSLWIAQLKHQAVVEMNEEGTEAAGATASEMQTKGGRRYPAFRADHPFLFVIRDQASGTILFLGRVAEPPPAGK